jgi:hypothetical protein
MTREIKQTGYLKPDKDRANEILNEIPALKIKKIDYEQAKRDAILFIREPAEVDLWSAFF